MVVEVEQAISRKSAGGGMKKSKLVLVQTPEKKKKKKKKKKQTTTTEAESPSYRLALKSIFSCRNSHGQASSGSSRKNLGCSSAPSICKVNNNNNKEQQCEQNKPAVAADEGNKRRASVSGGEKKPLMMSEVSNNKNNKQQLLLLQRGGGGGSSSSLRAGMQLRRLSGCYECHMVVDPIFRDSSSSMRACAAVCPCPDCGEIFVRQESLQLHQSIRHAVCELGSDDTSRNIIEIIFQSSWLKKQSPVCRIERILKVHNTARTLARFEEYREAVKAKASKKKNKGKNNKHPRCTADGNELLRFHCAALGCNLGIDGATHLCGACHTCAIIRHGFNNNNHATSEDDDGIIIRTMATSGRAHDAATAMGLDACRAMLVCRVIAGRVKRPSSNLNLNLNLNLEEEVQQQETADDTDQEEEEEEEYDSIAGSAGVYSNMEELQVFNPTAILPCFVVIYNAPY